MAATPVTPQSEAIPTVVGSVLGMVGFHATLSGGSAGAGPCRIPASPEPLSSKVATIFDAHFMHASRDFLWAKLPRRSRKRDEASTAA